MYNGDLIQKVWLLTKGDSSKKANLYLEDLNYVLALSKKDRFRRSFTVKKSNGTARVIVPAIDALMRVQQCLTQWLLNEFPPSIDYCYTGKSVMSAVKVHKLSKYAVVLDIKGAFDRITKSKLLFTLQRRMPAQPVNVLNVICDLLTYPVFFSEPNRPNQETTPQGCVSTPYVFNIVFGYTDTKLQMALKPYPNLHYTRYADNLCISSIYPFDLLRIFKNLASILEADGFDLSWHILCNNEPIPYLGTHIFNGNISLDPDKATQYVSILYEALDSPTPKIYYRQILGIYNWSQQVYSKNIPVEYLSLFTTYFRKIKRIPNSLMAYETIKLNTKFW